MVFQRITVTAAGSRPFRLHRYIVAPHMPENLSRFRLGTKCDYSIFSFLTSFWHSSVVNAFVAVCWVDCRRVGTENVKVDSWKCKNCTGDDKFVVCILSSQNGIYVYICVPMCQCAIHSWWWHVRWISFSYETFRYFISAIWVRLRVRSAVNCMKDEMPRDKSKADVATEQNLQSVNVQNCLCSVGNAWIHLAYISWRRRRWRRRRRQWRRWQNLPFSSHLDLTKCVFHLDITSHWMRSGYDFVNCIMCT